MKAHELTQPGLYWYSRDGEPRGFAEVRSDPGGEPGLDYRRLDASGWSSCHPREKGEFFGPVPEDPARLPDMTAQSVGLRASLGVRPETLAVIMLPFDLVGNRMMNIAKAFPDSVVRGGGDVMFIERVKRTPRKRERLDIMPPHPFAQRADGTAPCATCDRPQSDGIHTACPGCNYSVEGCALCNPQRGPA